MAKKTNNLLDKNRANSQPNSFSYKFAPYFHSYLQTELWPQAHMQAFITSGSYVAGSSCKKNPLPFQEKQGLWSILGTAVTIFTGLDYPFVQCNKHSCFGLETMLHGDS